MRAILFIFKVLHLYQISCYFGHDHYLYKTFSIILIELLFLFSYDVLIYPFSLVICRQDHQNQYRIIPPSLEAWSYYITGVNIDIVDVYEENLVFGYSFFKCFNFRYHPISFSLFINKYWRTFLILKYMVVSLHKKCIAL